MKRLTDYTDAELGCVIFTGGLIVILVTYLLIYFDWL